MVRSGFFRGWTSGRRLAVLACAAGLAVLGTAGQPAPAAPAPASSMAWTPCRDGFQCATVRVPLDYGAPHGATISLALIRLPAGDPGRRLGALLVNPGGPGGSGVDYVRGAAATMPLELRGRFDIVGFDPRGVLGSTPLRCFTTFDQAFAVVPPFAFPYTRAEEDVQHADDIALASACASHGGAVRDHMSTADVARDMDTIRQGMGDRKLNFLGFSYGSLLGQTYANMFPGHVRALVIDGVLDPIAWTTGAGSEGRRLPFTTRLRSDVGAQATLGEFFRLCDAAGAGCAFAPHAADRFAALAETLRKAPLVIGTPPDTFTTSYADVIGGTLGALFAPPVWPDLAQMLADTESQAAPAVVLADFARLRKGLGLDQPPQEDYPNVVEGFPGVVCSDSVDPRSFDVWRRAAAAADAQHGYFGRPWTWSGSACAVWPTSAGQDRYPGPWTRRTASPVLVVGNYFDPATRYQGAVRASQLLPNSRLLTYAGWGHTAFLTGNYCIDQHVTRYLLTTRVPAAGTVCRPGSSPFEAVGPLADRRSALAARFALPASVRRALTPSRD